MELYDLETHQKKLGPDYHRLKTMVKRSIEQEIRNKNFGARHGNYERNAVVKNPRTKQRVQRIFGDCLQWESNGQCSRGDNCSVRHDVKKLAKMTQPNSSPNSFIHQNERNASRLMMPRSRRLCKIETRIETQSDGSSHLGPGLLYPYDKTRERSDWNNSDQVRTVPAWQSHS